LVIDIWIAPYPGVYAPLAERRPLALVAPTQRTTGGATPLEIRLPLK